MSILATTVLLEEFELILRMLAGMAAGVAVGWERTLKQKTAGIRTFGLVGLGTASAAALFAGADQIDAASRVIQGVLTGIGFLGAGVIVLRKGDAAPHGLTTAAAIWVTAALGCAAGLGDWQIVGTATCLAILLLAIDHSVERWAGRRRGGDVRPGPDSNQTLGGSEARSKTGIDSVDPAGS